MLFVRRRAKRRQVITKEHWRALAGFFAGDWLGFVEYLGEQPHDEERIVTALPETKIMIGGKERAASIAATIRSTAGNLCSIQS